MARATRMGRTVWGVVAIVLAMGAAGCSRLDNQRIPPAPVNIPFATVGDWNVNGIGGALDYKRFIKEDLVPTSYHYSAMSATGFGGVLLVGDVNGVAMAYDLSCPVECRRDVRIYVDTESMTGECPKCHSRYDIFSLGGHPLSGEAAREGYGLRCYHVGPGRGDYMIVTN